MGPAAATLALALAIDLALGEYPATLHPVVWMGRALSLLERCAPASGRARQLAWGALAAVGVPGLFAAGAFAVAAAARRLGWAGVPLAALALKPTFALRALGGAGLRVRDALRRGDLAGARDGLRALCSRDPSRLGPSELAAGTVESLAENASDSVVAPLFWFALLGLPGAFAYRAANTLDARIGYRGRLEWLGKPAARLDDLWNLVPARLTALLLLAAGLLAGADARRGAQVLRRDGGATESPNAGRPMAAMAGLLGVALEKPGHYRLGAEDAPPDAESIGAAWRLVRAAALLAAALAAVAAGGLHGRT
ncbi:MAG TPA: adenosylcobinamide-phosphate synthase CbiB [Anaeromyxobacteraceae bacterium]|nr:adenosylcobinamide-phosphate synthase CbiB [Anaeromyxobacteraceae bacterium]